MQLVPKANFVKDNILSKLVCLKRVKNVSMRHFPFSPHRVDHRPVQRVGEQLRLCCGNLFYQALDVFTFLLCVGALYAGEPGSVHPEALVIIVIQGHQLPLARLFISLFVVKLVEDAVHGQLLPLNCIGLTGASCGTLRWTRSFMNSTVLYR